MCAGNGPGNGHVSASASSGCHKLAVQPEAVKALQVCIANAPPACLHLSHTGLCRHQSVFRPRKTSVKASTPQTAQRTCLPGARSCTAEGPCKPRVARGAFRTQTQRSSPPVRCQCLHICCLFQCTHKIIAGVINALNLQACPVQRVVALVTLWASVASAACFVSLSARFRSQTCV